jgi:hypothetical protein
MPTPLAEARKRLEQALSVIPDRYRSGVATAEWQQNTLKAAQTWKAAMQKIVSTNRWEQGVQKTSNEVWRTHAMQAADLIPTRLRNALDKWQSKFGPIYQTVLSTVQSLPPRTADPLQNVDTRVKPVVRAWIQAAGKA